MNFIDTHVHLQAYNSNYTPELLAMAEKAGIKKMICAGINLADWDAITALKKQYEGKIIVAYGLHPWEAKNAESGWLNKLEAKLQEDKTALVGECGLDGIKDKEEEPQNSVFAAQIELAQKYGRALLVHSVHCGKWLEKHWTTLAKTRFVLHSYNGKQEIMKQAIKIGGYISFSLSILRNKDAAELLKQIPQDRLLIETDSPWQGLEKGQENTPLNLPFLASELAKLTGEKLEDFAARVYKNSEEFING